MMRLSARTSVRPSVSPFSRLTAVRFSRLQDQPAVPGGEQSQPAGPAPAADAAGEPRPAAAPAAGRLAAAAGLGRAAGQKTSTRQTGQQGETATGGLAGGRAMLCEVVRTRDKQTQYS